MIDELELRHEIAKALTGESSLDALYSWLMSRSWNMHRDSLPGAVELGADVESLFFELSDGLRDEASVRAELSALVKQNIVINVTFPASAPSVVPSASAPRSIWLRTTARNTTPPLELGYQA